MDNKNNYKPVPNQRAISVNKEECSNNMHYAVINLEALNSAMRNLKPSAFALWLYFAQNQDKYSFWLSRRHVCQTTGMTKNSYNAAFNELEEKYYLIQDGENHFEFYETPHDDPAEQNNIKITVNKA